MDTFLKINRYSKTDAFKDAVLPILMEDEVNNNLIISIILDSSLKNTGNWLMCTVCAAAGDAVLIAFCTKPFNMLLYAPARYSADYVAQAAAALANELLHTKFKLPGVTAQTRLAEAFTHAYAAGRTHGLQKRAMTVMKAEKILPFAKAPGKCRALTENDLEFVPLWEQAFCRECNVPSVPLEEITDRIRMRLGHGNHFIFENGIPVAQAVYGRETPNGAVINWVYTPPEHRGRGYATTVTGELSGTLLQRGKKFCCLFADAGNAVSCGIYRKLGYVDTADFLEIGF